MSNALDEVAEMVADLQATLEWSTMLGTEVLPRERFERVSGPPIQIPSKRMAPSQDSAPAPRAAPRAAPERVAPSAPVPSAVPHVQPDPQTQSVKPKASPSLSSKWTQVMATPSTHSVQGPSDARLMIVRGAGSSADAEVMLDRMLENVLGIRRDSVLTVDLARDDRNIEEIGRGVLNALRGYSPDTIVAMGLHAVRALMGSDSTVKDARGVWHQIQWMGGEAAMRVTHHPDALLAMQQRGQTGAKRETFEDLKAVKERSL